MRFLIRSAILATLWWTWVGAESARPISVYVYLIPFENTTNDPTLSWMEDGLVDILSEKLNQIPDISVKHRDDLEKIMNNRNVLLHQPRGLKNILVLGKYKEENGEVAVTVQLVNIANWEQVDQRTVNGTTSEITDLSDKLTDAVVTMLGPFFPPAEASKSGPAASPAEKRTVEIPPAMVPVSPPAPVQPNPSLEHSKKVLHALDKEVEGMEVAMDLALGRREQAPQNPPEATGEWELELNLGHEDRPNPANAENTALLVQVLDNLVHHPYEVTLHPPKVIYDPEEKDTVEIMFQVDYRLKDNLIKDMLTSLPYSSLKQEGNLTFFTFTKDRFNFPDDLRDRISSGEYLSSPVIQFLDRKDQPVVVIADAPNSGFYHPVSSRLIYVATHRFSPLIAFTIGGWSLQVAMEVVDVPVQYRFRLPLDQTDDLSRVKLKFISQEDFPDYVSQIH
ncbi:MAG: hypothetical protein D6762_09670 [Candidatus Neomarinimicrobiota bacterium]|nr:MAG: hypothetical protein D6762_09670 [Candidatus Neomarinimicrobiota bacterium]